MFQAVKEITNDNNVTVQDKNGNYIGNTIGKLEVITDHFKSVFQSENAMHPFTITHNQHFFVSSCLSFL